MQHKEPQAPPQYVYNNCQIFNIERIDHFHQAEGIKSSPSHLPEPLRTPAAQELLHKAQAAGLLDEELQPTCTNTMAALIASEISDRLKLFPKWKPFEELWQMKKLCNSYSKAMEQKGTIERLDTIRNTLK